MGLSLRAVADDPLAAVAVGIHLRTVWANVWAAAGVVALVAGLLWGARVGVQFSLALIVLKALPVLIIGGFSSVLGTIVGGLVIGASEKLAEVYLGPPVGGGIENWFPYALALAFLAGYAGRDCSVSRSLRGYDSWLAHQVETTEVVERHAAPSGQPHFKASTASSADVGGSRIREGRPRC